MFHKDDRHTSIASRLLPAIVIILTITLCSVLHGQNTTKPSDNSLPGYNIKKPDLTYILPFQLNEVSGIVLADQSTVACVQDENGIIFLYDLNTRKITRTIAFQGNGDYEDIARAGNNYYILRSDGMLFEVAAGKTIQIKALSATAIPYNNLEGLFFDQKNNMLLIAPKDSPEKGTVDKSKPSVYGFDLTKRSLLSNPVFVFDMKAMRKFVSDNKIVLSKDEDKKYDFKFEPSAIALHPVTNRLYILSGSENLLFVFSIRGEPESVIILDRNMFTQPEGICFFSNGDMLISNEGSGKQPTLLRFNYTRPTSKTLKPTL
jgi:uncharacterized protein YjiK